MLVGIAIAVLSVASEQRDGSLRNLLLVVKNAETQIAGIVETLSYYVKFAFRDIESPVLYSIGATVEWEL